MDERGQLGEWEGLGWDG
uniref:Uncharacterized protein n=1 Tax=Zea mays TaxID=4577 RepID=C4J0T6_MAIZE|nr:unknown [Zea mays]